MYGFIAFNPYYGYHPFCGESVNSADPDQMPQNEASDQGLHCLLIDCPIKIGITMKKKTLNTEMDRSN